MSEFHKIGEAIINEHPAVFELVLSDILPYIDPKDYGLNEPGINPEDYYITSGDAIEKAKILKRDLFKHLEEIRNRIHESGGKQKLTNMADYESAIAYCAAQSEVLIEKLQSAKADNCFLETEWDNHHLLCIPKNPRR